MPQNRYGASPLQAHRDLIPAEIDDYASDNLSFNQRKIMTSWSFMKGSNKSTGNEKVARFIAEMTFYRFPEDDKKAYYRNSPANPSNIAPADRSFLRKLSDRLLYSSLRNLTPDSGLRALE